MAIEYRLTLAGPTPVEQVAERAFPEPQDRPTGTAPLLTVDLLDRYGFGVDILAGEQAYLDGKSDSGSWKWNPAPYVAVLFQLDEGGDRPAAVLNMLRAIRRVLDSGTEDAALDLNGNALLLVRTSQGLVKHNREWWTNYQDADDILPG
jgi:hypothetical protein